MSETFYEILFTWVAGGLVYALGLGFMLFMAWDDHKDEKERKNKKAS